MACSGGGTQRLFIVVFFRASLAAPEGRALSQYHWLIAMKNYGNHPLLGAE